MSFAFANWLDFILLLVFAAFVFYGLFFGLIKTAGSLIGVVVGAWAASRLYLVIFEWLRSLAFGYDDLGRVVSFVICFVIINRLICLLFALLDRTFNLISVIPFLKTINRLGGAALGLIEGGVVVGLFLYVIGRYAGGLDFLVSALAQSWLAPFFLQFATILQPLLPELLKQLQSVI